MELKYEELLLRGDVATAEVGAKVVKPPEATALTSSFETYIYKKKNLMSLSANYT